MKRAILLVACLGGCVGGQTTTTPAVGFAPVPTGTAVYAGSLAQTTTINASANGVSYTEVQTFGGTIDLTANFDTGLLNARISDPRSDFVRSSTQSTDPNYNFIEEATYTGSVSGTGIVSGTSFNSALTGSLIQTSSDRTPVSGAQTFTGTVIGQVSGNNLNTATGKLSMGSILSGQTVPLFTDLGFSATRN